MLSTEIRLDPTVLAFTVAATLVTALICGLVPALRASRPNLMDVLRLSGGSSGLRAGRLLAAARWWSRSRCRSCC